MEVVKLSERTMQSNTINGYGKLIIDKEFLYQNEYDINAGIENKYQVYVDYYDEYITRFTNINIPYEEILILAENNVFDIWLVFNEKDNAILRISVTTDKDTLCFLDEEQLNKTMAIINKYNLKEQSLGFYCKHIDTIGNCPIYDIDILYNKLYE
jgi:hypothetical protein